MENVSPRQNGNCWRSCATYLSRHGTVLVHPFWAQTSMRWSALISCGLSKAYTGWLPRHVHAFHKMQARGTPRSARPDARRAICERAIDRLVNGQSVSPCSAVVDRKVSPSTVLTIVLCRVCVQRRVGACVRAVITRDWHAWYCVMPAKRPAPLWGTHSFFWAGCGGTSCGHSGETPLGGG